MLSDVPRLKETFDQFNTNLAGVYDKEEARSICLLLFESELPRTKIELITDPDKIIEAQVYQSMLDKLNRCLKEEPVQYILGSTEFMGLVFQLNSNVLIPRPETEELVDWVINQKTPSKSILDVGTGSGCIIISLASNLATQAEYTAFDISDEALLIAKQNAELNKVEIKFEKKDILRLKTYPKKFDMIISNPPYVPQSELASINKNVKEFEPHLALFVEDNDPLQFYRQIIEFAKSNLDKGGWLYFEIHSDFARGIVGLLKKSKYEEIKIKKDISGKDRMIRARKTL